MHIPGASFLYSYCSFLLFMSFFAARLKHLFRQLLIGGVLLREPEKFRMNACLHGYSVDESAFNYLDL